MLVVLTNVFQFWKIRYYIRRHIVCKGYILYINIYIYIYTIYIYTYNNYSNYRCVFFPPNPNSKKVAPKHRTIFRQASGGGQRSAHRPDDGVAWQPVNLSRIFPSKFGTHTPLKTNISPGKMMVGRCISYWNSPFLGGHVNFQGCRLATEGYRSHQTLKMGRFCVFVYVYIL